MAKKKVYQVVATCTYKGQAPRSYVEFESTSKREINHWMKTRAYQTTTRTYSIEEVRKEID